VLETAESLWLRGRELGDGLDRQLRAVPDAEPYWIQPDGRLVRWDATLPSAALPEGDWTPLAEWLTVSLPPAASAGYGCPAVEFTLIRTEAVSDCRLLETSWEDWAAFALSAPLIRLNPLSFAVSDTLRVLVRGTPLPPIPGERFVEAEGIAWPAGHGLVPAVESRTLRRILQLRSDELGLIRQSGEVDVIEESCFVHASRSAVRQTADSLKSTGIAEGPRDV